MNGLPPDDEAVSLRRETRPEEPKCPVCDRPRVLEFRPFCSRRCRDVDLSRWMSGAYAIAGEEVTNDDDA